MPRRPDYRWVIETLQVLEHLAGWNPVVIGTPPLGIDVADSDIDIACHARDLDAFAAHLAAAFGALPAFEIARLEVRAVPSLTCGFAFAGWPVEIFGQDVPVAAQHGVRHFAIERRLLALLGPGFTARVLALRRSGLKTEPAFARLLGLDGDPYEALLAVETWPDARVLALAASS